MDSKAPKGPKEVANVVVDIMEQPTQAMSVPADDLEVVDNFNEATAGNSNLEVESRLEGEMDSESDALIDDDHASRALLAEDSPQKKKRDAETNRNVVVEVTAKLRTRQVIDSKTRSESSIIEDEGVAIPMQDQCDKSVDSAQVDETMSDSSSVTEVDEAPEQRNETTSRRESHSQVPQKTVVRATSEADAKMEADVGAQLESCTRDKHKKSVDTPLVDEVMSDASSITEVDKVIPGNLKNNSTSVEETDSHTPQIRVDVAASEAVLAPVGDSSHASFISEPAVFSPCCGLVSTEAKKKKTAQCMPSKRDTAVEDKGMSASPESSRGRFFPSPLAGVGVIGESSFVLFCGVFGPGL